MPTRRQFILGSTAVAAVALAVRAALPKREPLMPETKAIADEYPWTYDPEIFTSHYRDLYSVDQYEPQWLQPFPFREPDPAMFEAVNRMRDDMDRIASLPPLPKVETFVTYDVGRKDGDNTAYMRAWRENGITHIEQVHISEVLDAHS